MSYKEFLALYIGGCLLDSEFKLIELFFLTIYFILFLQNFCTSQEVEYMYFFLSNWYQHLVRPEQTRRDLPLTSFGEKSSTVLPNARAPDFGKYMVNSPEHLAWAVSTHFYE